MGLPEEKSALPVCMSPGLGAENSRGRPSTLLSEFSPVLSRDVGAGGRGVWHSLDACGVFLQG